MRTTWSRFSLTGWLHKNINVMTFYVSEHLKSAQFVIHSWGNIWNVVGVTDGGALALFVVCQPERWAPQLCVKTWFKHASLSNCCSCWLCQHSQTPASLLQLLLTVVCLFLTFLVSVGGTVLARRNVMLISLLMATRRVPRRVSEMHVNSLTCIRPPLERGQSPGCCMCVKAANNYSFLSAWGRCTALSDEVCGWVAAALLIEPKLKCYFNADKRYCLCKRSRF